MYRNRVLPLLASIALGTAVAPAAARDAGERPVTIEANLDFSSDYRYRGLSMSGREVAVQPSVTVSHKSGAYASIWGSNIAENGGANIEADVTIGYVTEFAEIEVDARAIYYAYPGASSDNAVELALTLSREVGPASLSLDLAWMPSQQGTGHRDNVYVNLAGELPIWRNVSLTASGGWEDGAFGDNKFDWSVGAKADLGKGFGASVRYIDTAHGKAGKNGDPTVVMGLAKQL